MKNIKIISMKYKTVNHMKQMQAFIKECDI